ESSKEKDRTKRDRSKKHRSEPDMKRQMSMDLSSNDKRKRRDSNPEPGTISRRQSKRDVNDADRLRKKKSREEKEDDPERRRRKEERKRRKLAEITAAAAAAEPISVSDADPPLTPIEPVPP